ncbi:MAG TPA: class II aldolase/adducin family protein [Acidimicrobiia bacterium]|nr:class II aldolase/adducin family protein [Acidimicrobiia bacterium]
MSELKGSAEEIKAELLWVARESLRTNLVHGTAGNFSARLPDGNVVMTPSSLPYDTMTLDQLAVVDLEGNVVEGTTHPTTEKALHLACLKAYDDIHAVIHCHAKFCTMFAITHQPIPCVIEEVEVFVGGDVPVANYEFTGSQELADEVSKWVGDRAAVLMANHGLLTVGKSPKDALKIANLVELTAEMVWGARALGDIVPLPDSTRQKMAPIYKMLRGM